jgi:hypothetical protein
MPRRLLGCPLTRITPTMLRMAARSDLCLRAGRGKNPRPFSYAITLLQHGSAFHFLVNIAHSTRASKVRINPFPLRIAPRGSGLAGRDTSSGAGKRKPFRFSADHLRRSDVGKMDMSIDVQIDHRITAAMIGPQRVKVSRAARVNLRRPPDYLAYSAPLRSRAAARDSGTEITGSRSFDETAARRLQTAHVADSQRSLIGTRCSKRALARIAKGGGLLLARCPRLQRKAPNVKF